MDKIAHRYTLATLLVMLLAFPAQARLRMGLTGGVAVNELHFDRTIVDANHRAGFTGGITADLPLPVMGLGIEASLLYTHRNNALSDGSETFERDYLEVPLHARLQFNILGLKKLIAPYVFTGPNFAFLFHDNEPTNYDNSKTYASWDVGAGVELISHLRVAASYGIGFTKAMKSVQLDYQQPEVQGKDRYWTITATWLF